MSGESIGLVGDLVIQTPGITNRYGSDAGFQAARRELHRSAATVANLELPLSSRGSAVPKTFSLRADPAVMADIQAVGISAVTLANNHMMDFGPEALADTLTACERAGIASCGAGKDLDAALAPVWLEVADARIALLNVACTVPIAADALAGRPGIAPLHVRFAFDVDMSLLAEQPGTMPNVMSWAVAKDQARVVQAIMACRDEGASAVIVAIHWGSPAYWLSPYQGVLCVYQRPLAHALIDAGADAICGHHPHQLHPVEVYRGKPILYSLGNFIFEGVSQYSFMEPEAVIVRLTFGDDPACELVPLLLDDQGFPTLCSGDEAAMVIEKVRRLSQPFRTEIEARDGIASIALV